MRFRSYCKIFCCVITLTACYSSPSSAIEDAIIAVVNDELVTLKDLKDYIRSSYVSLVAEGLDDQLIQTYMKDMEINGTNKLIEDKLILSKANIVGIKVREEVVDERIEELEEKYGSQQKLVDALIKGGATLTDLRNKIRDQFKTKFIIDHEVRSKIYVNPQEVTNFYEQNQDQYVEEDHIILESIFITYEKGKGQALAKAVEVFKYAVADNDFKTLVDQFSEASSIGAVTRGQLRPQIENIVFGLGLNDVSPLVEVDNGIYIFKLTGEVSAKISSLDDVKDSIYDRLFMDKFKSQFTDWLEGLKKDAYIEIKQ